MVHQLLLYGESTSDAETLADLIVCEDCAEFRTPVYHCLTLIGDAVVHEAFTLFFFCQCVPFGSGEGELLCRCRTDALRTMGCKMLCQFAYGLSLFQIKIIVGVEHLHECPLCPFVIFGIASAHLAAPIKRETDLVKLGTVTGYILGGCLFRVLACLDGILLGRKTICIISHRMKDVESLLAFEACVYVAGDIS